MLNLLFRRITLTGLLLTVFVGTGVLFGTAPQTPAIGAIAGVDLPQNSADNTANVVDNSRISANSMRSRKGPDMGWPFFSFRKGGR